MFIIGGITNIHSQDNLDLAEMMMPIDSTNVLVSPSYYTWGASAVKGEDGKYYLFYSRWSHGERKPDDDSMNYIFNGFAGWNKYSEIACAVSENLYGPYRHVKTILKGSGDPLRWDRFTMHNPQIKQFDGYYYLYFISNAFDSNYTINSAGAVSRESLHWLKYNCTQSIGVVKAKTIEDLLNGNYERPAAPIMRVNNVHTFEVANNPSVSRGRNGKYYMMYKSRLPNAGHMTFWMAVADKPDDVFKTIGNVLSGADMASEDPCMWYDKKRKCFYAVAKYYSNSLKLAPQFGALILISSRNGKDWKPAKHTLVSLKELMFKDGRKVELDRLERPFVFTDEQGSPLALFAAASIAAPAGGDVNHVDAEHNTVNVCIPLQAKSK
ncbi:MAG TPA: glycoside hydrolase family protein [Agriterribacter sp.]|nr:glycoside hydrolase family protein [Agriterribacter sp.]